MESQAKMDLHKAALLHLCRPCIPFPHSLLPLKV